YRKSPHLFAYSPFPCTVRHIHLRPKQVGRRGYQELPDLWVIGLSNLLSVGHVMDIQHMYHVTLPAAEPNVTQQHVLYHHFILSLQAQGIRPTGIHGRKGGTPLAIRSDGRDDSFAS